MSAAAAPAKAEPAAASPALDNRFMQLALALGRRGLGRTWPNPAVGAVIVKDGVPTGEFEDFATGFVVNDSSAWGRPVGVTVAPDGSLFVSEDANGTIWRITSAGNPRN